MPDEFIQPVSGRIKEAVVNGLAKILLSLGIGKPSERTKRYIRKVTGKLTKQLKSDARRSLRKGSKKSKSSKVALTNAKKNVKVAHKKND